VALGRDTIPASIVDLEPAGAADKQRPDDCPEVEPGTETREVAAGRPTCQAGVSGGTLPVST